MSWYVIHVLNSYFRSDDHGADYADADEALKVGVQAGLCMTRDECVVGSPTSSVEVSVSDESGVVVRRSVVTSAVAPLLSDAAGATGHLPA